jgi:hypothetical protein
MARHGETRRKHQRNRWRNNESVIEEERRENNGLKKESENGNENVKIFERKRNEK